MQPFFVIALTIQKDIYGIECEEKWSQKETCKKSYTNKRLDWAFRDISRAAKTYVRAFQSGLIKKATTCKKASVTEATKAFSLYFYNNLLAGRSINYKAPTSFKAAFVL